VVGEVQELIANSVNFQYWYGNSFVRPLDSGATKMYALLDRAFESVGRLGVPAIVQEFSELMAEERFPSLQNRTRNLAEIAQDGVGFAWSLAKNLKVKGNEISLAGWLNSLVRRFPGYAQDLFLKRAFLFFAMLYHQMEWFKNDIRQMPIPVDYQIPKMLHWMGVLKYSNELDKCVKEGILILSGSLMECELRAASMIACKEIALRADCPMVDVDAYL